MQKPITMPSDNSNIRHPSENYDPDSRDFYYDHGNRNNHGDDGEAIKGGEGDGITRKITTIGEEEEECGEDNHYDDDDEEEEENHSINDELDFSSIIARHDELDKLHSAFMKVRQKGISSICILEGNSGNGKSTLFHEFAKQQQQQQQQQQPSSSSLCPIILSGKFDELNCDPLSAIIEAYDDGLKKIYLNSDKLELKEEKEEVIPLRQRIMDDINDKNTANGLLGMQGAIQLATILPVLKNFTDTTCTTTTIKTNDNKNKNKNDAFDDSNATEEESSGSNTYNSKQKQKQQRSNEGEGEGDLEAALLSSNNTGSTRTNITKNEHSWNRIKFLFKALSLIMATKQQPMILFIDDLQWSDGMSLELLESLIMDKEMKYFFFVGAYRRSENNDDVLTVTTTTTSTSSSASSHHHLCDEQHHDERNVCNPVAAVGMEQWNNLERANITVLRIALENFTMEQLCDFIKRALWKNEEVDEEDEIRVKELAAAIHPKTLGNIFFTRQVLQELHTSGSLSFSRMTFRWEWNLAGIQFSDNVLDAVTKRIHNNTTKLLQKLLAIAAYMRSTFDVDSLAAMVDLEGIYLLSQEEIVSELDEAVLAGFLTNVPGSDQCYSFGHDRILQAAYNLIPKGSERDKFRFTVGSHLYSISRNKKFKVGRDWMIYSAADHFNATSHAMNQLFLTIVNIQAGRKCMSVAAFENASSYFSFALKSFGNVKNAWEKHYRTALLLHESFIEAELVQGRIDSGKALATTLIDNVRDANDGLRTKLALAKAMGREKSHRSSFELSRSTLQSMNMYASTTFGVYTNLIKDLLYVRRYFRNHSDEDIMNLPKSTNKRLDTVIELYVNNMYHGWFSGKAIHWLASCIKGLRTTLESGLSPHSGVVIMGYFMYCFNVKDMDGAHRFANLGLKILSRCDDQTPFCLQLLAKTVFLDSWSTNTSQTLDQFDQAYKSGMECGDFENALRCRNDKLEHQYSAGHPLALLDIQWADLVEKEELYGANLLKCQTVQQWFTTRVLRGKAVQPPLDFGSLLDFDRDFQNDGSNKYPLLYATINRLQIAVYWGNCDFAASLIEKEVTIDDNSHQATALRLFFHSIANGTLYRVTGKLKHKLRCKSAAKDLKNAIISSQGMNSWHRYVIASAHFKGSTVSRKNLGGNNDNKRAKKIRSILRKYDEGRELATARQHRQDAGLAAQLAAEFLMHVDRRDMANITKYLKIAKENYRDWGATALVDHLEQKYSPSFCIMSPSDVIAEPGMSERDGFSSAALKPTTEAEATGFFSFVSSAC